MPEFSKNEIELATRSAVRDILLGKEGQQLMARVAEEAAHQTLTDFLLKIGMDTTTPQAILALQDDMRHLRWWNATVRSATTKILIIVALIILGGWPWVFSIIRGTLSGGLLR